MKKGWVYILKSLKNGQYYIGSTDNLKRRLMEHEKGKSYYVSKFIKPFKLVFSQVYEEIGQARKAEKWLKSQKDKSFLERVIVEGIIKKVID